MMQSEYKLDIKPEVKELINCKYCNNILAIDDNCFNNDTIEMLLGLITFNPAKKIDKAIDGILGL